MPRGRDEWDIDETMVCQRGGAITTPVNEQMGDGDQMPLSWIGTMAEDRSHDHVMRATRDQTRAYNASQRVSTRHEASKGLGQSNIALGRLVTREMGKGYTG